MKTAGIPLADVSSHLWIIIERHLTANSHNTKYVAYHNTREYEQWRNYGPAAAGGPKKEPKGAIFKLYRVRWGIGGPFFEILRGAES